MRPVTFDNCFGTFFPGSSRKGVILCSSFGLENARYQPALASLAAALSRRGLNVLCFDYHGTGDSAGTSLDPGIMRRWIGNVEAAEVWLRRHGGVDTVSLAGLRLGAIIAALAASRIPALDELLLLAPPATGDSFVCELRHASSGDTTPRNTILPFEGVDLAGFRLGGQTIREIAAFNWSDLRECKARRVVILAENRAADRETLASAFASLDCTVAMHDGLEGFERAVSDFRASRRNVASWEAIANLVPVPDEPETEAEEELLPRGSGFGKSQPQTPAVFPMSGPGYIEVPAFTGGVSSFGGLFCRSSHGDESRHAAIFLPSARGHALYWPRLAVETARRMARTGIASLRLSDIDAGDHRRAGAGSMESELASALHWIKTHRFSHVTVIGSTDAPRSALDAAAADGRVDQLVLFDQPIMPLGASAIAESTRADDPPAGSVGGGDIGTVAARQLAGRATLAALTRLKDFNADKALAPETLDVRLRACIAAGKSVHLIRFPGVEESKTLAMFDGSPLAREAVSINAGSSPAIGTIAFNCDEDRLSTDSSREAFGKLMLSFLEERDEAHRPGFRFTVRMV